MREFMVMVKRGYFWVLCPLIVLIAGTFWFLGVGKLKKEKEKNGQDIKSMYTTLVDIQNSPKHPNANVAEGMATLIKQRQEEVATAWTEKYRQQTAEKTGTLTWPKELGENFINEVKDLRPIERKVDFSIKPDKELILSDRQKYHEHLRDELPKLAKSIGAKWYVGDGTDPLPDGGGDAAIYTRRPVEGGGINPGSTETLAHQSMVEWTPTSQQEILDQHFRWRDEPSVGGERGDAVSFSGSGQDREPNLLEILYAQEDLWVLQAIMNVIARTNEGATARFNAAIKEVEFIRMGKSAVRSNGRITRFDVAAADPSAMGDGMEREGMGQGVPPDGEMAPNMPIDGEPTFGDGDMPATPTGPDPAEGRYVDRDYQPLSAEKLRQVMRESEAVAPEEAYLAVAKRIPVRMRLKIAQKQLGKFLVECANSPLTIEVRQLRVNPSDDGSVAFDTMPTERRRSERGDREPMPMPAITGGLPNSDLSGAAALDAQSRTDLTVEVYGIVYFFNPVDQTVLGAVPEGEGAEVTSDPLAATGTP